MKEFENSSFGESFGKWLVANAGNWIQWLKRPFQTCAAKLEGHQLEKEEEKGLDILLD